MTDAVEGGQVTGTKGTDDNLIPSAEQAKSLLSRRLGAEVDR
ncbi:hypothetical protein [Nesterenkonia sp. F]|nr:hypothetical protein [Nesterenkonia sp. F]